MMNLLARMTDAIGLLKQEGIQFALAGGLIASLYRKVPRATADIDFAVMLEDESRATKILEAMGLEVHAFRKANLEGGPAFAIKRGNSPVYMLCGRPPQPGFGVDLILSRVPWVGRALERAQSNLVDFGAGKVPCLTVEDLLISKFYSASNQPSRFMDLDDLKSILESQEDLDWFYLRDQMSVIGIAVPESIRPWFKDK